MYLPYVIPLFVISILSMTGTGPMVRTAYAILANWTVGTAFVYATGIYDAWWFSIIIDAIAAYILLYPPAGKAQAVIGCTYIAQIVIHFIYSRLDPVVLAYHYWQLLTGIAFVQLAILGGWIGGNWGRRYLDYRRSSRGSLAHGSEGVGG